MTIYEEVGLGVFKEFVEVFMEFIKHSQFNEVIKLNYHLLTHSNEHE